MWSMMVMITTKWTLDFVFGYCSNLHKMNYAVPQMVGVNKDIGNWFTIFKVKKITILVTYIK